MIKHVVSLLTATSLLWVAGACQKPDGLEYGILSLSVQTPASGRVTDVSEGDESAVASLQVFVFDEQGMLETSGISTASHLSLRCRLGEKTVWAVVNAPVFPWRL